MKISLSDRSQFIASFRNELLNRGLLEIDSLMLMPFAGFDPQIDSMKVKGKTFESYLHNSPELYLKYLLTTNSQALERGVFFLGHGFRDAPKTDFHRKEFCMAEWYRPKFSLKDLKKDVLDIILKFTKNSQVNYLSLEREFTFDYNDYDVLFKFLETQIRMPPDCDYEDLFSLLWIHFIEPKVREGLFVVEGFPRKLRSMSKLNETDPRTCKRFEICLNGIEIANAYEEETSPDIVPENHFLRPLLPKLGLCSGIALGIDRLLACSYGFTSIEDVMYPVV